MMWLTIIIVVLGILIFKDSNLATRNMLLIGIFTMLCLIYSKM